MSSKFYDCYFARYKAGKKMLVTDWLSEWLGEGQTGSQRGFESYKYFVFCQVSLLNVNFDDIRQTKIVSDWLNEWLSEGQTGS